MQRCLQKWLQRGFSLLGLLVVCVLFPAFAVRSAPILIPKDFTDAVLGASPFLESLAKSPNSFQQFTVPGGESKNPFPPFFGDSSGQGATPQQGSAQQFPSQQNPGTTPGGQIMQTSSLEGCWASHTNQGVFIMLFINGMCGINVNGQQVYGPYSVSGNQLHVQFSNGKTLDLTFSIQGNQLSFSNGLVLSRQNMPNQEFGSTQGTWGSPHQSGTTPLEGQWMTQLANGVTIIFAFHGNQYTVSANGQITEQGNFSLQENRLEYTITQGQAVGQRGVNLWQLQGSMLLITLPNGGTVQFQKI